MPTEYLVLKLTKAVLDEDTILKMSRDHLMADWRHGRNFVATGKDKPAAAVGAKALGAPAASVHYDPELEKQRLAFEMQNTRRRKLNAYG